MAFIGNTPTTQAFTPAVDYFSGNGSTTAFTLSRPVASVAQVEAVIENVVQNPSSAYTISGNTITFTSAPPSGTNNIYVRYTSPITQVIQPGQGTVGPVQLDYASLNGTGAIQLPSGTTAQRPSSPVAGQQRYNTTTANMEFYVNGVWAPLALAYQIEYLIVAGGGAGGYEAGGGAGGYRSSVSGESSGGGASAEATITVASGTSYTVTVGAGGTGSSTTSGAPTSGSNSSISGTGMTTITSIGGGGGGIYSYSTKNGASGGSGGGASSGSVSNTGSGTSGQGYAGGYNAGGGGGAGAAGSNGYSLGAATGGVGVQSSINGSATYRAGGGGGAPSSSGSTSGGNGGGGAGVYPGPGGNGTANTGGGGGGFWNSGNGPSGSGGSGVVIIRYIGSQRGTGGTVTSSGGYTIHTFTSSGTYTA